MYKRQNLGRHVASDGQVLAGSSVLHLLPVRSTIRFAVQPTFVTTRSGISTRVAPSHPTATASGGPEHAKPVLSGVGVLVIDG